MTIPHYDETLAEPLGSDLLISERVDRIVGRAQRRQLWLLFLDSDDVQLPLVMPADVPQRPELGAEESFSGFLAELVHVAGAASLIVVLERPGSARLGDPDRAWFRCVDAACAAGAVRLHATVLSHREGVRLVATGEYR